MEVLVLEVLLVLAEFQERMEHRESQVHRDRKGLTVHRVQPDLKVLSAHRV